MTVRMTSDPPPARPQADTPATLTYQACQLAITAQRDLCAEADAAYDDGHDTLTEGST
jgi:hypothetical protein